MDWTLFEYEVSSGFNYTKQEQNAIAKLEKIIGDRLFDLTIHNGKWELKARQYVGVFPYCQKKFDCLTAKGLAKKYREIQSPYERGMKKGTQATTTRKPIV
ncbi:MAG: hypothetical protein ACOYMQ_14830 [Pseudanabaena sp.]